MQNRDRTNAQKTPDSHSIHPDVVELLKENATLLKEKLTRSISTIIDLIALFIIQTVLLPIAFLYLAVKLVKTLALP
jgi:hypothetical protein